MYMPIDTADMELLLSRILGYQPRDSRRFGVPFAQRARDFHSALRPGRDAATMQRHIASALGFAGALAALARGL